MKIDRRRFIGQAVGFAAAGALFNSLPSAFASPIGLPFGIAAILNVLWLIWATGGVKPMLDVMRLLFLVPKGADAAKLQATLEKVAADLSVELTLAEPGK